MNTDERRAMVANQAKDLFRMTLRNKVRAVLTNADNLEKDAENMVNDTTLLNNENNRTQIEVLRAKARGIRGTVWDLAEEEYKEFYGEQDPTLEFEDPAKGVGEGDI